MNANLWTECLRQMREQVKLDLRAQGLKPQTYTHVEIARLAKAKLIEECKE